jgi:beta-aspartyl-dipeptidase (metallo-type)
MVLLRHARVVGADVVLAGAMVDILVAGGRVVALEESLDVSGVALDTVDLEGRWVVPGLVDAPVHLTGGGGEAGCRTRVPRVPVSALVAGGVTTAVGVLGTDGVTRTPRDLVACALALREEGLSAWCYTGSYAVPVVTLTGSVKDDIVFVDPIIGVGELAISDHRSSQPSFEELLRIASDAYVAGLTANKSGLVHLHLGDGPRGLELVRRALEVSEIPSRVWHPTHLNRNRGLWDEAKSLARGVSPGAGGAWVPYFDVTAFADEGEAEPDPDTVGAAHAVLDWLDAGLPAERLTLSSDGGGCLPTFDADGRMLRMDVGSVSTLGATLRALVSSGLPLERAAPFVTANPARVLGLDLVERGRKGHIAVGGDADLLVLDEALAPWAVMARGRWMMEGGALTVRGTFDDHRSTT